MALLLLLFACIQHDLYEEKLEELDTSDTGSEEQIEEAS